MQAVREPAVAGMFYPASPAKLREEVNYLLEQAEPGFYPDKIKAIVAPHAGYVYSGRTAACAYKLLNGKMYETVAVISPSHREYFPGISVYPGDAYMTPLGAVPVDIDMRRRLTEEGGSIFMGTEGHRKEHALEVHLPFLQTVLGQFKLLPLVIGDQHRRYVDELAEKLARVVDDKTLIVASSDLSHFHSKRSADALDSIVEDRISSFDYEGLLNDLSAGKCEACGGGPIAAAMKAAWLNNARNAKVVDRSDSGDVSGDDSEVVGYLSAVIY